MNAITPGSGPHVEHGIAGLTGVGEEDLVAPDEPDGHRVHEDVAVVARVERAFAADGRDAHAVPVAADSADHAPHQMARLRVVWVPEPKAVEDRHGPSTHREHVPQNPADPGGGPLVGFDE